MQQFPRSEILNQFRVTLKASAHSFKHLLRGHFKISLSFSLSLSLSLSLSAHIASDEYHAWFHLNAAIQAARNTEQVTITHYKKKLVHGRIRTTNTRRPPTYKSTIITIRPQFAWYEWRKIEWNKSICFKSAILINAIAKSQSSFFLCLSVLKSRHL